MIKRCVLTLIIGMIGLALCGQTGVQPMLQKGANDPEFLGDGYYFAKSSPARGLEGELYYNAQWEAGRVLTVDTQLVYAPLRYRILDEEIQVLVDGQMKALLPERLRAVQIGDAIFIPRIVDTKRGKPVYAYFEVLVEGSISLLLRRTMTFQPADYNPALNIGSRNDRYVIEEDYYYLKGKLEPRPFKQTTRAVLNVLRSRKKAVAKHAKSNNLSVKSKEDLISLFAFYNRKE